MYTHQKSRAVLTGLVVFAFIALMISSARVQAKTDYSGDPDRAKNLNADTKLELVSQIGGISKAVFSTGPYTYLGEGPALDIFDTSDLTTPLLLGRIILPGIVEDIYVNEDVAYVAAGEAGLQVLDVSNPAYPARVIGLDTPGDARGLDYLEDYIYLADGIGGLRIINVNNPRNPFEASRYQPAGMVRYVESENDYVYLIVEDQFHILDVSDPTSPSSVSWLQVSSGNGLTVAGDYAVTVGRICTMSHCFDYPEVIDISEPDNPDLFSNTMREYPNISSLGAVFDESQDKLLVYFGSTYLIYVVDPIDIEYSPYTLVAPGIVWDLFLQGEQAYLATEGRGMGIIDISIPEAPSLISTTTRPTFSVTGADSQDGQTYITGSVVDPIQTVFFGWSMTKAYMIQIETSDPKRLREAATFSIPGVINSINLEDSIEPGVLLGFLSATAPSYKPQEVGGLLITDLTASITPTIIGMTDSDLCIPDFQQTVITGSLAVVAAGYDGLRLIDISTLSNPTEIGYLDTAGYARDVAVSGHKAYVADSELGWQTIDISDPTGPVEIEHAPYQFSAYGVTTSGNGDDARVYLSAGVEGLQLFETSPTMRLIGSYDTPGFSMQTAVDGNFAYIADGTGGLRLVDVSDPSQPQEVASFDTAGSAVEVVLDNGKIYIADGEGGLLIFELVKPKILPGSLYLPLAIRAASSDECDGSEGVYLYEDIYYRGECIRLTQDAFEFTSMRVGNDRISSIRIIGNYEAILYAERNFQGNSILVTADIADLSNPKLPGVDQFNDRASSVQIRQK